MKRTVFFCDWCLVQAPGFDVVGEDWMAENGAHLCGDCKERRGKALAQAESESRSSRRAMPKRGTP